MKYVNMLSLLTINTDVNDTTLTVTKIKDDGLSTEQKIASICFYLI